MREELLKLCVYVHCIFVHYVFFQDSVGHGLRKAEEWLVFKIFEVCPQITPLNRHQEILNFLGLGLLLLLLIWAPLFSWKFEYIIIPAVVVLLLLRSYLTKHWGSKHLIGCFYLQLEVLLLSVDSTTIAYVVAWKVWEQGLLADPLVFSQVNIRIGVLQQNLMIEVKNSSRLLLCRWWPRLKRVGLFFRNFCFLRLKIQLRCYRWKCIPIGQKVFWNPINHTLRPKIRLPRSVTLSSHDELARASNLRCAIKRSFDAVLKTLAPSNDFCLSVGMWYKTGWVYAEQFRLTAGVWMLACH